ncbi:MAG: methyltransferase domain-containing protein [Candidatus Hydrogenedentes bacterium]|nr:methyltransferase domain-containing protein [Candidatus Hydrogenedentota bacterium]
MAAPQNVGAITPSSRHLGALVISAAKVPDASIVVEFGPGTGAITEVLVEEAKPGTTLLALEINEDFIELLKSRFPDLNVIHDSATETRKYLNDAGLPHCDAIVSGLPWTMFSEKLQDELLDAVLDSLRPGGIFATYMYLQSLVLPSGIRFRRKLRDRFTRCGITETVWRNIPPARVVWGEK